MEHTYIDKQYLIIIVQKKMKKNIVDIILCEGFTAITERISVIYCKQHISLMIAHIDKGPYPEEHKIYMQIRYIREYLSERRSCCLDGLQLQSNNSQLALPSV